jgi:hypothetical protein
MTHKITVLEWVAIALVIIGSLNWGLVGFFGFNLVSAIFGDMSVLSRIVYALVGIAALLFLFMTIPKFTKGCEFIAGRKMEEVPR